MPWKLACAPIAPTSRIYDFIQARNYRPASGWRTSRWPVRLARWSIAHPGGFDGLRILNSDFGCLITGSCGACTKAYTPGGCPTKKEPCALSTL